MLKNYFKTAIRNLRRNRAFAVINILGLVLGISGTVVIYRIITFEQSFDTYHSESEQVYRLNFVQEADGDRNRGVSVMHPLREALRTDFPDWTVAGLHHYSPGIFTVENDQDVKQKFKVEQDTMEFLPAVSNFDPVDTYGTSIEVTIQTVSLPLMDQEQVISLG